MSITDEMVERAAAGIQDARRKRGVEWYMHGDDKVDARAALTAALGDVEPLEDVLAGVKGQRITLYQLRHEREQRWSATLMAWPGDTPDKFSVGFGSTIDAAIRGAVANAKGERK
jgi:hypothetical protein